MKTATAATFGLPLAGCGDAQAMVERPIDPSAAMPVERPADPSAALPMEQPVDPMAAPSGGGTNGPAAPPPPTTPPLEIGMLIYPGMTAIDMIAPQLSFAMLGNVHINLVWKDIAPLSSDTGVMIVPSCTLDDCPAKLDILFVGGAREATFPLMSDKTVLEFLADRGSSARFVTSVCTGSLLLAAAGLLRGYKATGNWATRHLLNELDATKVDARVVVDRNRITGAGVTAGLDFGLRVAEIVLGPMGAQLQQLMSEYAPDPPFMSGSPDTAPPEVLAVAQMLYAPVVQTATEATAAARAQLGL